jgi:putative DNA primase/helicase
MRTAVVMHGAAEGTGKNLFFGAIKQIYGEYASLITQTELEDKFNGWMSRLLFLIANEVISKQEMRHHVGRLKNMVTEDVLPIRDMWAPLRYESNHANMVFLTNEIKAMQIMPGDRRYMVIYTPGVLPENYYLGIVDEIAKGGVAALYHYLINLDLAGFGEHTKPILTAAKEHLIEMGLDSTQDFWTQLHEGLLWPLEYKPCLVADAYRAYTIFCARAGHRNPRPMNMWSHEFMAMNGVTRRVQDIDDPDATVTTLAVGAKRRQASVFIMGEIPLQVQGKEDQLRAYIKTSVVEFRGQLREYQRNDGLLRPRDGDGDGWGDPGFSAND